ncbi:hypothetical protein PENTCL1PPCAC_3326, partial [Pristionchus entomophagus]
QKVHSKRPYATTVDLGLVKFEREVVFPFRILRLKNGEESLSCLKNHFHQHELTPGIYLSPFLALRIVELKTDYFQVNSLQPVDILD